MRIAHSKTDEEWASFARKFFDNRLETFRKDIAICLTSDKRGQHAYFPALMTCIAFAELLGSLYAGKLHFQGLNKLQKYAKKFMEPEYTDDPHLLELFYYCLRHKVAHLAYPYAVFDTHSGPTSPLHKQPRRFVTWAIHEYAQRPAIRITGCPSPPPLSTPTPWAVSYDCLIDVHVPTLAKDIDSSIERYLQHLRSDQITCKRFGDCMEDYFPQMT
jgi:hypothetical protein